MYGLIGLITYIKLDPQSLASVLGYFKKLKKPSWWVVNDETGIFILNFKGLFSTSVWCVGLTFKIKKNENENIIRWVKKCTKYDKNTFKDKYLIIKDF